MALELRNKNHTIGGYFETDKITHKEFEKLFTERILTKIKKFNSVQVHKYGTYLWKQVDSAKSQIIKDPKQLKNKEEVLEYYSFLTNQQMDKSKPLWEFRIIENYTKDSSIIIYRMHHSFIDGVGFVSLMATLNDKPFTTQMAKRHEKQSLIQKVYSAITTPITLAKVIPEIDRLSSDEECAKIRELKGDETGEAKYHVAKPVSFAKVSKCYKSHKGMTFNDFMNGILSKSFKQWYLHYGLRAAREIFMIIPVNMRNLPSSYEDLQIDCGIVGSKYIMPLEGTVEEGMKALKPVMLKNLAPEVINASKNLCWLVPYLPEFLGRILFEKCVEKSDIAFSNIPYSKDAWRLCGKEVRNITFFNNLQAGLNVNTIAITYKDDVQFMAIGKKNMKMDVSLLTDIVYKNMEEEIAKLSKTD